MLFVRISQFVCVFSRGGATATMQTCVQTVAIPILNTADVGQKAGDATKKLSWVLI